jgi:hypothetical protein
MTYAQSLAGALQQFALVYTLIGALLLAGWWVRTKWPLGAQSGFANAMLCVWGSAFLVSGALSFVVSLIVAT